MRNSIHLTEAKAEQIRKEPRFKGILPKDGKFHRNIPLSSPVLHGDEQTYIAKALAAGLDGSMVSALETEIAGYLKAPYAAALSSGSAAIRMALRLATEKVRGKRVFCSDFAEPFAADAVVSEGGTPVFVDVSPEDWSLDPEALEVAFQIYPDVKLVVMNHAYGFPGQAVEVKRICEAHGALLIEDASESFGASRFSSTTGTVGDFGILDFGTDKIITGGSGSMLLTKDEGSYRKAKCLATGANIEAPWIQHVEIGESCAMGDLAAAMIMAQMKHITEHINRKCEIYERYWNGFEESGLLRMNPFYDGAEPNYMMSCAVCESGILFSETRSDNGYSYTDQHGTASPMEICDALHAFGAEARPVYKPLSMQPVFGNCDLITIDGSCRSRVFSKAKYPWQYESISRELFETTICLPSDVSMTELEQDTVIEIIHSCFDEKKLDRMAWVAVEELAKTS